MRGVYRSGMNRKKEILIAVIAIIMMIIIGQSYIIHNQARFDGDCLPNMDKLLKKADRKCL